MLQKKVVELSNELCLMWRKPFWLSTKISSLWLANSYHIIDWRQSEQVVSIEDISSMRSGLWQFVCEKELQIFQWHDNLSDSFSWHGDEYRLMLSSIQEDKEKFILDNIKI